MCYRCRKEVPLRQMREYMRGLMVVELTARRMYTDKTEREVDWLCPACYEGLKRYLMGGTTE